MTNLISIETVVHEANESQVIPGLLHKAHNNASPHRETHLALAEESFDIINSGLHGIFTVSQCTLRIFKFQLASLSPAPQNHIRNPQKHNLKLDCTNNWTVHLAINAHAVLKSYSLKKQYVGNSNVSHLRWGKLTALLVNISDFILRSELLLATTTAKQYYVSHQTKTMPPVSQYET